MTVSISTEYLAWDNTESVTVVLNKNGLPQAEITIDNALRISPRSVFQIAAGVRLSSDTVVWWIPIAQLGTDQDMDTDGLVKDAEGVRYRVQSATRVSYGNSYSHWNVTSIKEISET